MRLHSPVAVIPAIATAVQGVILVVVVGILEADQRSYHLCVAASLATCVICDTINLKRAVLDPKQSR